MAWVAVNKDNSEMIFEYKPECSYYTWLCNEKDKDCSIIELPKGTIKRLLYGKELTWDDEPVEL